MNIAPPVVPLFAALFAVTLTGCAIGPEYRPPELAGMPTAFKHDSGWRTARAPSAIAEDWWVAYGDETLATLQEQLTRGNPDIGQALARLRQTEAALSVTRAALSPTLSTDVSLNRGASGNFTAATSHDAGLSLRWLFDPWGKTRRSIAAGEADLAGSKATLDALRLSLRASLARQYIQLRTLDQQRALLEQAEAAYARSLTLTSNQYHAGMIARADVVQAENQLAGARAQRLALVDQRAIIENAIAVLTGQPPSTFELKPIDTLPAMPAIPSSLPIDLLLRRPDITAAERRVAGANARIGVAQAAWLPELSLGLSAGYRAANLGDWFNASSRVWAIGPSLAMTLFDGGARDAVIETALATHGEAAEAWRAAILLALQETEDAFARLRSLEARAEQQAKVLALAEENERLVLNRYRAGQVSYLEVSIAQNGTLSARRNALDISRDRLEASVALIAALGGGWSASP